MARKKKAPLETIAAVLTIRDTDSMSKEQRKDIADWLRLQAKNFVKDGDNYSKQFRARYIVVNKK